MTPKQAKLNLAYILANQKTVSISKIKESIDVLLAHNEDLKFSNEKHKRRIKRQRNKLGRLENE